MARNILLWIVPVAAQGKDVKGFCASRLFPEGDQYPPTRPARSLQQLRPAARAHNDLSAIPLFLMAAIFQMHLHRVVEFKAQHICYLGDLSIENGLFVQHFLSWSQSSQELLSKSSIHAAAQSLPTRSTPSSIVASASSTHSPMAPDDFILIRSPTAFFSSLMSPMR